MANDKKPPPSNKTRTIAEGAARGILRATHKHFGKPGVQKLVGALQAISSVVNQSVVKKEAPVEESQETSDEDLAELQEMVDSSENDALEAELEELVGKGDAKN